MVFDAALVKYDNCKIFLKWDMPFFQKFSRRLHCWEGLRKTSRTLKTWALSAMCVGMVVVSNKDNKKLGLCEDLSDLKEYVHCKLCIPAEQKCCVNLMPTWGSGRFHH